MTATKAGASARLARLAHELPEHKTAAPLDDLDWAILEIQKEDVFFSYSDLAKKWGVTEATIRNRIKRLKALGVMNLILVINPYKVGYSTFAIVGICLKSDASPSKVVAHLRGMPGVSSVVLVTGSFDFFVQYVCEDMEAYRRFVAEDLRKVQGIERFESFMGLDLYEQRFEVAVLGPRPDGGALKP